MINYYDHYLNQRKETVHSIPRLDRLPFTYGVVSASGLVVPLLVGIGLVMDGWVLLRLLPDLDELALAVVARAVGLHFAHGPEGEMMERISLTSLQL